jgi:CPA1 family monovalent cation:H+ antiporter
VDITFQVFLVLLGMLAFGALLARQLDLAPAVVMLAMGVALAFVPGLPAIELPPELVLLVVLPPLIYSASVAMSWREFRANIRPIALLAIGCVLFTACAVATVTHFALGLQWGIGFLLGAIVAPPDVVAPLAIARKLRLPRRILVILEGEGLANDATALILYRFATVAITTGAFSLPKATATFAGVVVGEVLFGLAIGWLSLRVRRWARDSKVEITLSMITPYLAFWTPEHFGGSGVLATVACGLYISWNGPLLISSATRLQGVFFWDLLIYLIEGVLFLLTGFQMRLLIEKSKDFSISNILFAIAVVSLLVFVARFIWVYTATYAPRWFSRSMRNGDPVPDWRIVFVIAFTGVRGAVSLAAALALPFTMPGGDPFPYRDFILFVSFGVIVLTLIGLGLGLPLVVRKLGVSEFGRHELEDDREAEIVARKLALETTQKTFDGLKSEKELSNEIVALMETRHETRSRQVHVAPKQDADDHAALSAALVRKLIGAERAHLHRMLRDGKITDETRRRIERDLDLEEAIITNREDVWKAR